MIALDIQPLNLTDEQFYQLCLRNRDLRLERTATGELIVMSPAGSETAQRNLSIGAQLWLWNEQHALGVAFDSSAGFKLPNSADRSPDASWIVQSRWDAISPAEKRRFAPICPDFVVELRSPSDDLKAVRAKMQEYIDNGACLGWLIDPETQRVEIYRPGQAVEVLHHPATLSGESILPGFVLNLEKVL